MSIKATGTVIQKFLANKGYKSTDCGPFIAIYDNEAKLLNLLEIIKKQFPNNNCNINDKISNNLFISIDK